MVIKYFKEASEDLRSPPDALPMPISLPVRSLVLWPVPENSEGVCLFPEKKRTNYTLEKDSILPHSKFNLNKSKPRTVAACT
jgi:hypothetical protein